MPLPRRVEHLVAGLTLLVAPQVSSFSSSNHHPNGFGPFTGIRLPLDGTIDRLPKSPRLSSGRSHKGVTESELFSTRLSFAEVANLPSSRLAKATEFLRTVVLPSSLEVCRQGRSLLAQCWWILPMFLALVPVYTFVASGELAAMPNWWKVVPYDSVVASTRAHSHLITSIFLGSNFSFVLAGFYLLSAFSPRKKQATRGWTLTPYSMLGVWVLASGLMSTVFHSVQALGSHALAEALCYIDHGFAISSTCYFFQTCGPPNRLGWTFGLLGIAALCMSHPSGYAWLHSLWHVLSSLTAVVWGHKGYAQRSRR